MKCHKQKYTYSHSAIVRDIFVQKQFIELLTTVHDQCGHSLLHTLVWSWEDVKGRWVRIFIVFKFTVTRVLQRLHEADICRAHSNSLHLMWSGLKSAFLYLTLLWFHNVPPHHQSQVQAKNIFIRKLAQRTETKPRVDPLMKKVYINLRQSQKQGCRLIRAGLFIAELSRQSSGRVISRLISRKL